MPIRVILKFRLFATKTFCLHSHSAIKSFCHYNPNIIPSKVWTILDQPDYTNPVSRFTKPIPYSQK